MYIHRKPLIKQTEVHTFLSKPQIFSFVIYCLLETILFLILPTKDFVNFVAYVDCFAIYTSV